MKRQLENYKRNFKNNYNEVNEIYIGDPDKFNTEMNNELKMSREIIKKYIYFIQSQRENTRKLNNQIQDLKEQISSQKANSSFITPTPKFINSNNPQLALLSEIFTHKKEKEEINQLEEEIEKLKQTKAQNQRNKETILQKVKEEKINEEQMKII